MTEQILTQEKLKTLLSYDPDTGVFTWQSKPSRGIKVGSQAGTPTSEGYLALQINKKKIYAHRAVWLYVHGVWPKKEIDHINRNRSDNRLVNLRAATRLNNSHNTGKHVTNTSGHKGVTFHSRNKKWQVQMSANNKTFYVGQFDCLADAVHARAIADLFLHKDF